MRIKYLNIFLNYVRKQENYLEKKIVLGNKNGYKEVLEITIALGKDVTANKAAEEHNLTENKKYMVLARCCDLIEIVNDKDVKDWYSLEYFKEFRGCY